MKKWLLLLVGLLCCASLAWAGFGYKVQTVGPVPVAGCTPTYGTELQTDSNAAEPDASDTNATTGLTNSSLLTFESTTTAPSLGTYHINAVSDALNDRFYDILTGLTNGTLYALSFDVRHVGSGNAWSCRLADITTSSNKIEIASMTSANTTYAEQVVYWVKTDDLDHMQCVAVTDTGGVYFDNYSIKEPTLCYGDELHTSANAASLTNEANGTTGWTVTGIDTFESTSVGTPHDGTYHLHFYEIDTPTSSARAYIDIGTLFSLQEGTKYMLRFWAKHAGTAGATWRTGFSTATSTIDNGKIIGTITDAQTAWFEQGVSFIYTSGSHRYFTIMENNAANNGELWIDGLTVKEITGE